MNCSQRDGGQIAIDFLTGITIFIFALFFLFNFVSASLVPFTDQGSANVATVDRASDQLYNNHLTSEDKPPGVLNESKAEDYLSEDIEDIKQDLGIEEFRRLNITVLNQDWEFDDGKPSTDDFYETQAGEELKVGGRITEGGSASVTRLRVGYMDGGDETVHVRVWIR